MNARKLSPFILVILAAVATLAAEGDCETRNDPAGPEPTPAVSSTSESTPASEPGSPPGRLLSGGGTVADVVDRVLPGVVKIISPLGAGTGFIISPDGLVVTNRHVVGGAKSVTIELLSGKRLRGRVTFTHRSLDLARVQIEARGHYTAIPVGDSESVRLGEEVIAIGYPLGRMLGDEPTVSVGIVSAKRDNLLQTDAALNPGNSGGPLVNTDGEVVGVVVSRLEEDSQGRPIAGIGFAIPINEVDAKVQGVTRAPTPTPDPNATPAPTPEPTPTPPPTTESIVEPTPTPTVEQALKAFLFCERLRLNEETYWGISPSTLQNLDPRFSGTLEPGDYIRILTPESNNGAIRVKVYPHDLRSVNRESNDRVWIDWDILVLQPEYRFDQLVFTCED